MSTVKSSSENLTLNADGAGNDVIIQNNGTESVRVDSAGGLNLNGNLRANATSTETRFFDIGVGRTGNGASYADFVGDTTYSDYGLRLIRAGGGENTTSQLIHRGTGQLRIQATDAGSIRFRTSNVERAAISSAGDFSFNSGYGSSATAYGCRAWVKFNGSGTVAIYNSANVSSITDLAVGRYRVNFTTAMVDADFAAVSSNANRDGGCYGHSTTDVGVFAGESAVDSTIISVAIFR